MVNTSLLKVSNLLSTINDLLIELNISDIQPNTILINKSKIDLIKEIFPEIIINDKIFKYDDLLLEICYTTDDILGLSYSYSIGYK